MSKKQKLIDRILTAPKDFRWEELEALLKYFDYMQESTGKTGGSRRKFFSKTREPLYFHKPHPKGILKSYQVKKVIECLRKEELI